MYACWSRTIALIAVGFKERVGGSIERRQQRRRSSSTGGGSNQGGGTSQRGGRKQLLNHSTPLHLQSRCAHRNAGGPFIGSSSRLVMSNRSRAYCAAVRLPTLQSGELFGSTVHASCAYAGPRRASGTFLKIHPIIEDASRAAGAGGERREEGSGKQGARSSDRKGQGAQREDSARTERSRV